MNDDSFARLVAEEIKNKVSDQQREYLKLPENWGRWQRAVSILLKNLDNHKLQNFKKVQVFNLAQNLLNSVPMNVTAMCSLQTLNLSGNPLNSIPNEISNLVNLSSLIIVSANLTALPATLYTMANLKLLWLSNNKLSLLDSRIFTLKSLEDLRLSFNQLQIISIGTTDQTDQTTQNSQTHLSPLKYLYLDHNKLRGIPSQLVNFTQLKKLDLSYNNTKIYQKNVRVIESLKKLPDLEIFKNDIDMEKYQCVSCNVECGNISPCNHAICNNCILNKTTNETDNNGKNIKCEKCTTEFVVEKIRHVDSPYKVLKSEGLIKPLFCSTTPSLQNFGCNCGEC